MRDKDVSWPCSMSFMPQTTSCFNLRTQTGQSARLSLSLLCHDTTSPPCLHVKAWWPKGSKAWDGQKEQTGIYIHHQYLYHFSIHLVLELRSHKLVALKIAKYSLARIYPATSGYDFFSPLNSYFVSQDLMTHSVSRPKTPSIYAY